MPELPDIEAYLSCLRRCVASRTILDVRISSPFLLRSVEPPIEALIGRDVRGVQRLGKRIVFELTDELFAVLHLMIAGRLQWLAPQRRPPARITLAVLTFEHGALAITEAGKTKRAALYIVCGRAALAEHDPGGLACLTAGAAEFAERLTRENRTLKRALTDPRLFDGIGSAYSDEILHAARLSPVALTRRLAPDEIERLRAACVAVLSDWRDRLVARFAQRFPGPGDITAFRPEFAVHGKFGQPCPACKTRVQRIRYAENETNYCPTCQTGGRVLADRSLSRLLKDDWPRTVEELG